MLVRRAFAIALPIAMIFIMGCAARRALLSGFVMAAAFSDDTHIAYIVSNGAGTAFHTAHIEDGQITADSVLLHSDFKPAPPVAFEQVTKRIYFVDGRNLLYANPNRIDTLAVNMPITTPVIDLFADADGGMLVLVLPSDVRAPYEGHPFWRLVWMREADGAVLFDTEDCYSDGGFWADSGCIHIATIDTAAGAPDTNVWKLCADEMIFKPSDYSLTEIREHLRSAWVSPTGRYRAVADGAAIKIEK